jgi:hypothetical protein
MGKFSNRINDEVFINNFNQESVYILGLLWAYGHICKNTNSITIECVKDDINYFYPIFQKTGDFNLYERQRPNRRLQGTINGCSLKLSNFLKENDYTNKSSTSPCKIISKIPKNLLHYFYLGWSDGDGCFYHSKTLNSIQFIISGSYDQDWSSIISLCEQLNIQYRIDKFITKKTHKYSRFLINKNNDILIFGEYIYNNSTLGLIRKREKFNSIKNYVNEQNSAIFLCYDRTGNLVNEFNSLKSASDWLNKGRYVGGSIRDSIIGRQSTAYNYIWKETKRLSHPTH